MTHLQHRTCPSSSPFSPLTFPPSSVRISKTQIRVHESKQGSIRLPYTTLYQMYAYFLYLLDESFHSSYLFSIPSTPHPQRWHYIATVFSHTSYLHPPSTAPETQTCTLESRPSNQTQSDSSNRPILQNSATSMAVWHGSSPFVGHP